MKKLITLVTLCLSVSALGKHLECTNSDNGDGSVLRIFAEYWGKANSNAKISFLDKDGTIFMSDEKGYFLAGPMIVKGKVKRPNEEAFSELTILMGSENLDVAEVRFGQLGRSTLYTVYNTCTEN